ncbi:MULTISPECIES: hypothetical protein [Bacilli]|uniref:Uncharacterized protein n=2 Tax=Ligilactobacillus salivarius TaxID=1624 RepID=A0A9X6S6J7_9LACO|nr:MULTISPECIES: hypothetical protein [Bacilli]EGL98265.1 hypothetical protein NIAS840_01696 [Ligilactobacillus salivarius NIAS840]MBE7391600.1 hypothetical protein [Ligilactobacillus salivarius]MDF4188191.1 hypothetical protein [Ligilactobacillus salivarius]MDF4200653.1 hypothetical protein [Bacillus subtilis]OTF89168.1 hypothetical protein A8C38_08450 [Ligilactobacillus salivarius]
MVLESQKKASRKYEKKNPDRTRYNSLKRGARNFISPKAGSKSDETTLYWNPYKYYEDLVAYREVLNKRIDEVEKQLAEV